VYSTVPPQGWLAIEKNEMGFKWYRRRRRRSLLNKESAHRAHSLFATATGQTTRNEAGTAEYDIVPTYSQGLQNFAEQIFHTDLGLDMEAPPVVALSRARG